MNPCPCGFYRDSQKPCTCAYPVVTKYQKRISGPLLDRIDIHIEVPRVDYEKLSGDRVGEPSECIRARVQAAMSQLNLSARAYHRILKLARTISDLAEALQYRPKLMMG
jgi:magnesium chelatase family protein